jgi:hypothetical protein
MEDSIARPSRREGRLGGIRTELRFAWWSRYFLWMVLAGVIVGGLSVVTVNGAAVAASQEYQQIVREARGSGVDIDAELTAPLHVENNGDNVTIDNPVRYGYENARAALGMLQPSGYAANAAQVAGFLLAPLVAFGAGMVLALKDYRHRTIRLRAVRSRLGELELASSATAGILGIAAVVGAISAALVGGAVTGGSTVAMLAPGMFEPLPQTAGLGAVGAWVGFAVVASVFFGACGVATGLVTRSLVAPMATFTAFQLMVPILGPWDPRAMILSVGNALAPLAGTLRLRPVAGTLAPGWNLAVLAGLAGVLLLLGRVALSARPRWGAS